ncbi:MAG: hypothetical protein NTY19_18415 [Planctomycetota bacterium]|nr:hypothetical protein [Planctomycetota bacterium]
MTAPRPITAPAPVITMSGVWTPQSLAALADLLLDAVRREDSAAREQIHQDEPKEGTAA